MKPRNIGAIAALLGTLPVIFSSTLLATPKSATPATAEVYAKAKIERGQYLTVVAGCNDCHTAGYVVNDGQIPVNQWLLGDNFGWRGPWGTTYGTNLRLYVQNLTEQEWIQAARTLRRRPPMPWFNLNAMSDDDLGALYAFMRSLGDAGAPAPASLPAEQEPTTPYAQWVLK